MYSTTLQNVIKKVCVQIVSGCVRIIVCVCGEGSKQSPSAERKLAGTIRGKPAITKACYELEATVTVYSDCFKINIFKLN